MIQLPREYFDTMTEDKLKYLAEEAEKYLSHRKELFKRYKRKSNVNEFMKGEQDRLVIAFEFYIVNMAQGYLAGKEPKYSVIENKGKKSYADGYKEAIDNIRRYNDDAATFIELMHDYLISTAAYLYVYENEDNEVVYTRFDSQQTVCVYDYGTPPYPVALLRKWKERDADNQDVEVLEIITDKERRVYRDGKKTETEPLSWGDVPAIAFENPDDIAIFEPAMDIINTYENLATNVKNMTQYNDAAKLILKGYRFEHAIGTKERGAEEEAIYKALCLVVDGDKDNNGDVSWLLKQIDYSGVLAVLKQMHDLITMLTGVPNMTDQAFSNADNASALGYKLYALDQYSATADRVFKKGFLRLWEIITNRLNLKGGEYNFRDIDIAFNRNIPTDKDKSIERAVKAKSGGLASQETAITMSGIEVDARSEIERIEAEKEDGRKKIEERVVNEEQTPDNVGA